VATSPTSGPGGGNWPEYVQKATKTLTNAQVKALPTTAITVIPAPGAGKKIELISARFTAYVHVAWVESAYPPNQAYWQLLINNKEVSGLVGLSQLMWNSTPSFIDVEVTCNLPLNFGPSESLGYMFSTNWFSASALENQPLVIKDNYNGVPDYTGGHASNYVIVEAFYTILNVPLS
jgi:hypothetical protein